MVNCLICKVAIWPSQGASSSGLRNTDLRYSSGHLATVDRDVKVVIYY